MSNHKKTTTVLIIGAGLGGLALAQLLLQGSPSIKVLVFERDENENSREQGYCIGLEQMGYDVLKQIPTVNHILSDEVNTFYDLSYFRIVNQYLKKIIDFNAKGIKLIYRQDLRQALLTNIDVKWNKRFISYKMFGDGVEAFFDDGTSEQGTILIGCDGSKSIVRSQLIPEFIRDDLRIVNIGGITEHNDHMKKIQILTKDSLVRILGKQGYTLLILPFRRSWMWAMSWPIKDAENDDNVSTIDLPNRARQYFSNDEIVRLIELTSPSTYIGPYRIYSAFRLRKNPFPNNPHVTLLGDAAHPMTTHAGKGANTAFADAYDLANFILHPSLSSLAEYEDKMFKRGYAAVQMSLSSTKMIHSTGYQAILRDFSLFTISSIMKVLRFISLPFHWFISRFA